MCYLRAALLLIVCFAHAFAGERHVLPTQTYFRIYMIVPLGGFGSDSDPIRPLYAPLPDKIGPASGVLGFSWIPSDDGKLAFMEIVAHDRSVVAAALADKSIQTFIKGVTNPATIEAAFQRYRHSFTWSQFDEVSVR